MPASKARATERLVVACLYDFCFDGRIAGFKATCPGHRPRGSPFPCADPTKKVGGASVHIAAPGYPLVQNLLDW